MSDTFLKSCEKLNVTPKYIGTYVLEDVYLELVSAAQKNDCTLEQLLRDMCDYMLEHDHLD